MSNEPSANGFPHPIPRGWYAVAWSDELAPGEAKGIRYFGRDLALFRTEAGRAHVLDAYCPHLGAHLGDGRVKGDQLACPFHGWEWSGEGRCTSIPYAKRIPAKARTEALTIVEHSGAVFAWYDPDGKPPAFEAPELPELSDPQWAQVERHEFQFASQVQEIFENGFDPAHFQTVHGVAGLPENHSEFDGHRCVTENRGEFATPKGPSAVTIRGVAHGLGIGHLHTYGLAEMVQLNLPTPIDRDRVHVRWQFAVPKTEDGQPSSVSTAFAREFVRQFNQDIPIWERKRHLTRPVLCFGDGDISGVRRWIEQFY